MPSFALSIYKYIFNVGMAIICLSITSGSSFFLAPGDELEAQNATRAGPNSRGGAAAEFDHTHGYKSQRSSGWTVFVVIFQTRKRLIDSVLLSPRTQCKKATNSSRRTPPTLCANATPYSYRRSASRLCCLCMAEKSLLLVCLFSW